MAVIAFVFGTIRNKNVVLLEIQDIQEIVLDL
jgi:hypothetical protein